MEIITIDTKRLLQPKKGYMLKKDNIITDYLILGKEDNGEGWEEITKEEADDFLLDLELELNNENEDDI